MSTKIPQGTVYYDISLSGYTPVSSGIEEIFDLDALDNALKMFLLADYGDYLGQPGKGGFLTNHLNKPMRQVDAIDLQTSLEMALKMDFSPALDIYNLQVKADLVKRKWNIAFVYVAPSIKLVGSFNETITGRAL